MIIFDHVSFSYGNRSVLKDLSFSITDNERVAILGGSGEGKTTILKLIMGLLRPDSGYIMVDGEDITIKTESELRDVRMKFSIVFQEGALFDSLNVRENVAFCLREYAKYSEEELDRRVRELLSVVGVEQALDLMPDELSGGMHRRVAIARSLAAFDPVMFLYDEPTSGLDPVNADTICRLIIELSSANKGFIIVTHKIYDAMRVAGRFMFIKGGIVVFDGSREMLEKATVPEIQIFMSELRGTN
ncbi:MAG: ATP-binding cassette domain-containing protein [Dissulfurispiraceae bacterium]|jgi:phospholipid/cholesterol/gamma-HCH transport system ATP-binding protein